jgi:lysophospholipase L1-like esterase
MRFIKSLKILFIIVVSLFLNSCDLFISSGYIDANDPLIIFEGRIDFTHPKSPRFDWPGSAIHAVFEGRTISVKLTDGNNDYNVLIDGVLKNTIRTDSSTFVYKVSDSLSPGMHRITLTKRTEGKFGIASFEGFIIGKGKTLHPLAHRYKRKIEFIGDSFIAGFGSDGKSPDCEFSRETQNNYISYGTVLARKLKAYHHTVAISGIGVARNHGDSSATSEMPLPYYYDRTCFNDSVKWDFSLYQPDVVVIRLGRNDYWGKPFPRRTDYRTAYLNFLETVRSKYADAHIFALCGPIRDDPHCDYVKSAVREMNDDKIHFVKVNVNLKRPDDFGCQYHPNKKGHEKIAAFLEPIIRKELKW